MNGWRRIKRRKKNPNGICNMYDGDALYRRARCVYIYICVCKLRIVCDPLIRAREGE